MMTMRFESLNKSIAARLPKKKLDRAFICKLVAAAILAGFTLAAGAQVKPTTQFGLDPGQIAAMEIGVDYAYFHANAPPAQCGCFSLEGVGGGFAVNGTHGLSLVVDIATASATHIDGTPQSIRILNFLGGPRYSYRTHSRFTPYVQVLVGGSLELSNYAVVQNKAGFAVSGGGGVNRSLGKHIGWKIVEADYLHSQIYNGSNNRQNDLRVTSGVYFRLGPRE
jgi:outer membrane immunogenic protein